MTAFRLCVCVCAVCLYVYVCVIVAGVDRYNPLTNENTSICVCMFVRVHALVFVCVGYVLAGGRKQFQLQRVVLLLSACLPAFLSGPTPNAHKPKPEPCCPPVPLPPPYRVIFVGLRSTNPGRWFPRRAVRSAPGWGPYRSAWTGNDRGRSVGHDGGGG